MNDKKSIISTMVIIRWCLTILLILFIYVVDVKLLWVFMLCAASFFCELYWYLWQKAKRDYDELFILYKIATSVEGISKQLERWAATRWKSTNSER